MRPKLAIGAVIILIGLIFLFMFCVRIVNIKPIEAGVRVVKFGGERRVVETPIGVGIHFYNPVIHDIVVYRVSTRSYPTDFIKDFKKQGKEMLLEFKTTDGQNVKCDFTVQYSLITKEVPKLHTEVGPNYEEEILMPRVRSIARILLGGYSAEELYQGKVRDDIQQALTKRLDKELRPYHILVKASLIRAFDFSKRFEAKIEEKKLAAQQVEINKNLALAEEEKAKQKEAAARGEKLAQIQGAEGQAKAKKIAADAEKYRLVQEASGNLAIYKADAEGKRLAAQALGGGQNVVALKFAENIPDKLRVFGVPVGENSTSLMDLNGVMKGLFKGAQE